MTTVYQELKKFKKKYPLTIAWRLKANSAIIEKHLNPDEEIKYIMKHPASLLQICRFRNARIKNVSIYLLGKLPAFLCVAFITCIGKLKKLI